MVSDQNGKPMTPAFSHGRSGRLYRYYVAVALQRGETPIPDSIQRVPAPALEAFVTQQLSRLTQNPAVREQALRRVEIYPDAVHLLIDA